MGMPHPPQHRPLEQQFGAFDRTTVALATAMLVALLGFYLMVYRPTSARLAILDDEVKVKQLALDVDRNRASNLSLVKMEVSRLQAKLERFDKQLPPRQELAQFVNDITEVSAEVSVKPSEVRPHVPRRKELFTEAPFTLKFEADFLGVCRFLQQTEGMQRLTRVRSLSLRSSDRARGHVDVEVNMNIYFSEG